jgi:hypothetical protein
MKDEYSDAQWDEASFGIRQSYDENYVLGNQTNLSLIYPGKLFKIIIAISKSKSKKKDSRVN